MGIMTATNRFEIKYLVETSRFEEIKRAFTGLLVPDANNVDDRGYYNYSIYFDSPDHHAYLEKHEGQSLRVKPRIRFYRAATDDPPIGAFLELKKRNDRTVSKSRLPVPLDLAERLLTSGPVDIEHDRNDPGALGEFLYLTRRFAMLPSVTVLYHRSAYHSPIYPQLRLTFDRGIRCSLRTGMNVPTSAFLYALEPRQMIVEMKFNEFAPELVMQRCRSLGLTQVTFSKFGVSVERCYEMLEPKRQFD